MQRPWKGNNPTRSISSASKPGEWISVNLFESLTKGFFTQAKGNLSRGRYTASMVFVDHFSRLSYIYMQKWQTSEETVNVKMAFEQYAATHGMRIQGYHANNGMFAENAFVNIVKKLGQHVMFCGINAHHQNGKAKKRIWDLQDQARAIMMQAINKWPQAITPHL